MGFSSVKVWYFSGTGNARFAANQICETAIGIGQPASSHNIIQEKFDNSALVKDSLLGFCYPTHGFNAPPVVLKFLISLPKGRNRVFLLNTRAGMKLSKIHTPGLGGVALWLPMLILMLKGYKPIGFRPLDMPSNWISLHPGLKPKVVMSIKGHCSKTLESFTKRIIIGKPALNGLLWLPLDLAVVPIAVLYYLFGRFALAKTFFASYSCNGCGACIKQCPVKAIAEKDGRPYWTFSCESCMRCMNTCPQRAIEIHHGFTVLLWWAAFSFLPTLFFRLLFWFDIVTPQVYSEYRTLVHNAGVIMVGFVVVFCGYMLLHWLLRFQFLNRIITYTSLTHFKFWRRYILKKSSKGE